MNPDAAHVRRPQTLERSVLDMLDIEESGSITRFPSIESRGPLMKKEKISFEVSQDLLTSLKLSSVALAQSVHLLAAIAYFRNKKLSLGKAAQLAGLNRLHFMDLLTKEGIVVFDYDELALASDLEGISQLRPDSA